MTSTGHHIFSMVMHYGVVLLHGVFKCSATGFSVFLVLIEVDMQALSLSNKLFSALPALNFDQVDHLTRQCCSVTESCKLL